MKKILSAAVSLGAATLLAFGEPQPWATPQQTDTAFQELNSFLQGAEMRLAGSSGNLAMEEKINALFTSSGYQRGEIKFRAACFIPGETSLSFSNRPPVRIYPLHPTVFRPGNFKEKDFSTRLVYAGRGASADLDKIKGIPLEGACVLMEFDCGTEWFNLLRFGVEGFIFIEPENYDRDDALAKVYNTEVAVPRFLIRRAAGKALRLGLPRAGEVRIKAKPSRWENKILRDLWVLIPGADPDLSREVAVITAPLDSNCIVPEMADGAQAGANLFCLAKLLDEFKLKKPARSVLLAAVNAHTLSFAGEKMLAWHMLAEEKEVEKIRDALGDELRANKVFIDYYSKLRLEGFDKAEEELLISWRFLIDESTGKNVTIKKPLVTLAKSDINRLKNEKLILQEQKLPKQEEEKRKAEINRKIDKYVNVLILFNKVGAKTKLSDLSEEEIGILKGYIREVITYNSLCVKLYEDDLRLSRQNDVIREALKGNKAAFVISLSLDWSSPGIGFYAGKYPVWARRWGANTFALSEQLEEVRSGRTNPFVDTLTMRSGLNENYYFAEKQGKEATIFQAAGRTPAFELLNVFTSTGRAFLPDDAPEKIDKANFANQSAFLRPYLRALLNERKLTDSSELDRGKIAAGSLPMSAIQIKTYKFDEYSATVIPEMPVPDTAVVVYPSVRALTVFKRPLQSDVICGEVGLGTVLLTDQRAATVFYGISLPKRKSSFPPLTTAAFHCDRDFTEIDHVIDAGEAQKKMSSDDLSKDLTLGLIECREIPVYPLADSSLVSVSPIYTEGIIPLTVKGNATPRKYGISGVKSVMSKKAVIISAGGPAAFYPSKIEKTKFVTDKKRLALNATDKETEGRGYASAAEFGPDFFRNAVGDLSVLNRSRIKKLKDVANELVGSFAARGDRCLAAMRKSLAENDYVLYTRQLYEGLGAHVKSYEQAKQTTDDMLKAIVVYMALLLPFCFFVEKLVFNFVKIEHEMGMFAALFVATFFLFRQIHPAFRMAQAAEAIFIAFVMGALGLFVISILRGRFEGEMQLLFRSYLSGIMDEAAYSTVTQKAMLIGVNNMKRRRIRTLLTTMTIVLIAFAMLSFTSISKKVNPTIIHKSSTPAYTGFMFTWPGKSQMDEGTFAVMRDLFAAFGEVVERRWKMTSDNTPYHVYFNNGRETMVDAVLGLAAAEDGFLGKIPVNAGRYFSSSRADEALISSQMAENLGLDPAGLEGVTVNCGGYELKVAGIYDDDRIRNLQDLNNIPILPIKRISQAIGVGGREIEVTEELESLGTLFYVDPLALLIVPSDIARRMGAFPFSVSVKLKDDAPVWPLMDMILTSTGAKFYLGSLKPFAVGADEKQTIAAGAYYIGSNYKTSVGGLAVLLIPLIIAATIILNTMLGSVYERKKEIAVYNAIGLNPHHIGLFFLAESFVYGVIGSVGGYLIGQILSLLINYTGWVKGINFNYSSLSVAYVILFTIVIVLLSTIYPAFAAVKTAVPSGKRTWSMPAHQGNAMEIIFPFIYQPKIASGVLTYLREYFARFTEISIGDLIAAQLAHGRGRDAKGHEAFKLDYHIALAPYDLGVTEDLKFNLSYDDFVKAYRLTLKIERVSGQDVNWITTNRPFLERLRKYLMRWRNLDAGQQKLYVQQAAEAMKE